MRVLFAGSPAIALPTLRTLASLEPEGVLAAVLTNPDSAKGRSGKREPTEVGAAALELNAALPTALPVLKFDKLDETARKVVSALKPDLLVSFAYGKIFGPQFLALFPLGGINVHPSLLPRWRGATPVQAAIMHGDAETAVCVQKISREMDRGEILARERFPLSARETALSLSETVAEKGAALAAEVVRRIAAEGAVPAGEKQDEADATYCSLITREMGRIDWNDDAATIDRQVRAFTPWPLCLTRLGEAELYVLEGRPYPGGTEADRNVTPGRVLGSDKKWGILIQTGNGIYAAEKLQFRTKKALDWQVFLNGAKGFIGATLG
jgi:methionyl-tRNA formyltransferase